MRPFSRASHWLTAVVIGGVLIGCAVAPATVHPGHPRSRSAPPGTTATTALPSTTTTTLVPAPAPARVFDTGNEQLDAVLPTLPAVLFEGGATVHYGYNPLDTCCHTGGYNPAPNDVWVGPSAFSSASAVALRRRSRAGPQRAPAHCPRHRAHCRGSRCAGRAGRSVGCLGEGRRLRGLGAGPERDGSQWHHILVVSRTLAQPGARGVAVARQRRSRAGFDVLSTIGGTVPDALPNRPRSPSSR